MLGKRVAILNRAVRVGFIEIGVTEEVLEGGEEVCHEDI